MNIVLRLLVPVSYLIGTKLMKNYNTNLEGVSGIKITFKFWPLVVNDLQRAINRKAISTYYGRS